MHAENELLPTVPIHPESMKVSTPPPMKTAPHGSYLVIRNSRELSTE